MARRWWFFKNGPHGNKRHVAFSFLQPLLDPKNSFPDTVMFQLIRVNDSVILPVPFEVTVESGRRMAARVEQEFVEAGDERVRNVWVASNANGYFGYTTTPEEYSRQNYEGGHTLYGRHSTPYLTAQLGVLARHFKTTGDVQELKPEWRYLLKVNSFHPEIRPGTGRRQVLEQPTPVWASGEHEEDYVTLRWQDVGPGEIDFHEPLCRVEVKTDGGWTLLWVKGEPIHDDGYDLEVRHLGMLDHGMGEYEVRWYNPVAGGEYRFVIEPRHGRPRLVSRTFTFQGRPGEDRRGVRPD